jgi:hypothetical protein
MSSSHVTRRLFLGSFGAAMALAETTREAFAQAPAGGASGVSVEKDVVFGKGGDVDLKLDIYKPATPSKRTAIIHYHGGGFTGGSKDGLAAALGPMTQLGYVNIAAQYRLAGVAKWPSQIHDVKAAIRWTRMNAARLGIDPARVMIAGYSAGGHLALFAAGTQNMPDVEGGNGTPGVPTALAGCLAYYAVTGEGWSGYRTGFPCLPAQRTPSGKRRRRPPTSRTCRRRSCTTVWPIPRSRRRAALISSSWRRTRRLRRNCTR